MTDADPEVDSLVALLREQSFAADLDLGAVTRTATRTQLGIGSLEVIMLVAAHIERTGGQIDLQPEWVTSLDDIEGILSVMRDIDALCATTPS